MLCTGVDPTLPGRNLVLERILWLLRLDAGDLLCLLRSKVEEEDFLDFFEVFE